MEAIEGILTGIACLLGTTYGTPLKWELHDILIVRGEATVYTLRSKLFMLRKGVQLFLPWDLRSMTYPRAPKWDRWVHVESPNARLVWRCLRASLSNNCGMQ